VGEGLIKLVCLCCALVSVFTTFGIIYALLSEAIHFFRRVPLSQFFGGTVWSPTYSDPKFGVLPLIGGTVVITVGAGLIAIPIGLAVGVYLSEYARPKARAILKPALEILAGIPTVVYGFFGLFVVTPFLRTIIPGVQVYNAASGAIVVGVMILPLVASLCEDAIRAVPRGLREGAYGLGATKFEVVRKVVLPAAVSGIMASIILAMSRAVGETMAVVLAVGTFPQLLFNPLESVQTMTAFIVQIVQGETSQGSVQFLSLFAVAMVLFLMTLGLNLLSAWFVRRCRQAYR